MNTSQALVIMDAQVNMFDEKFPLYDGDRIIEVLLMLIEAARKKGVVVIYMRNNGGEGEPDEKGTPGWEIHPMIKPKATEIVIDKHSPDAFENTKLQDYLEKEGIEQLIIAGMQTELCVETSANRAVELGYEVVVVADGHSTFDFDDTKAVDEIERVNAKLAEIARVANAAEIRFQ